jgi:type III secretion protein V
LTEGKPILFVYQLDIELQEVFRNSIRHGAAGPYLAMEPDNIEKLVEATHKSIGALPPTAQRPVIVAERDIRRFVKKAIEYDLPNVAVISHAELTPDITVHSLGIIGGDTARQTGQQNLSIA